MKIVYLPTPFLETINEWHTQEEFNQQVLNHPESEEMSLEYFVGSFNAGYIEDTGYIAIKN